MEKYYYYSEAGCVKIGNENFNSLFLNGKGEGTFWICLCNKKEKQNKEGYEFISQVSGRNINLYENNFNKKIILKLNEGSYSIYCKKGNILIEKA